ncbi:AraC family transcriptional regulator [Enterococcus sp. CSURQ0835]|uniref:AraC family transcriptional regulator n=1 Tax=Enterococcus sp. CSURQ0835 TaxID=2681394 RepID=UPI00135B61EC|nr:AraC family transcriptional regulator [Enterococcus sp. CSURQ0835]
MRTAYSFLQNDFFDLVLYQYGHEQCEPHHTFGPAHRNHYLLHYILSGKGTLHYQDTASSDRRYDLKAGQAFLIVPNKLIRYSADDHDPWEYMWVEIDGLKAREYLGQAGLSFQQPIYNPVSAEASLPLLNYFKSLVERPDMSAPKVMGTCYFLLDALIESSTASQKQITNSVQQFYIQSTVYYIEDHYAEDITVEDMAQAVGLNRSYFSKLFKKITLQSPQDFIISFRINKACELLRSKELSIAEVAKQVGYHNQFYFSKSFKKVMADSPSDWRKKQLIEISKKH